jgi:hypothetical protein
MGITFPALLAVKLIGTVLTIAEGPPTLDIALGCKAAVTINQAIDLAVSQDYQSCIDDERSARDELAQNWSKYDAQERARCIGQTEVGGFPSCVEVLECLLVTVNAGDASLGGPR